MIAVIFYTWKSNDPAAKCSQAELIKWTVQPIAILGGVLFSVIMMLVVDSKTENAIFVWFHAWGFIMILAFVLWLIHICQTIILGKSSTKVDHRSHSV